MVKTKLETLIRTWDERDSLSNPELTLLYERVCETNHVMRILGMGHRTRRGMFELESSLQHVIQHRGLPTMGIDIDEEQELRSVVSELVANATHAPNDGRLPDLADRFERATETLKVVCEDNVVADYVGKRGDLLRSLAAIHADSASPIPS